MNAKPVSAVLMLLVAFGCATDPNHTWFEGAAMNFQVTETAPGQYNLVAEGAGAHGKDQVERAFLFRAGQLCGGKEFEHEYRSRPYEYSAPTGTPGFYTRHSAFMTAGTVKCK